MSFSPGSGRWARLSLLIAVLMYISGAALGPAMHVHGGDGSPVVAVGYAGTGSDIPDSNSGSPASHDELGCFVCQALGALGAPSVGTPAEAPIFAAYVPALEPDPIFLALRSTTSQARAPPAV